LVSSFVDPRKRFPPTVKSYHQQFEFFLLKSSTTLLHERSHGRYAGVPLDEVKRRVSLEHTRAQANEELTETLQQYESEQAAHFDHVEQEWERQFKDPDDVFFAAADRKKEIREQIKALQKGLAREKASPKQIRKQK